VSFLQTLLLHGHLLKKNTRAKLIGTGKKNPDRLERSGSGADAVDGLHKPILGAGDFDGYFLFR